MPKLVLLAARFLLLAAAQPLPQPAGPADRAVPARRQRGHHGAPHRRAARSATRRQDRDRQPGGASGNIGMEAAARAEPDGHSLVLNTIPLATNQALFDKLAWDPIKDFARSAWSRPRSARARDPAEAKGEQHRRAGRSCALEPGSSPTPQRASAPLSTCAARCSRTRPRPSSTCYRGGGRRSPTRSAARST